MTTAQDMTEDMTEDILGYAVWAAPADVLVARLDAQLSEGTCCRWLACLNPHSYTVALSDAEFGRALLDADWLIPDGVGIVLASRIHGGAIERRVTGWNAFVAVNDCLQRMAGKVFFLGSTEATLATIRQRMARDYPAVQVVGCYSPPYRADFSDDENVRMIDAVNASGADVVWVAMTAPKQEKWLLLHAPLMQVKLAGAIGAVFDFYAGKVQRSSPIFQRLGLEWLPRLLREPRRLWRRMLISAPVFMWHVLTARRSPRRCL